VKIPSATLAARHSHKSQQVTVGLAGSK